MSRNNVLKNLYSEIKNSPEHWPSHIHALENEKLNKLRNDLRYRLQNHESVVSKPETRNNSKLHRWIIALFAVCGTLFAPAVAGAVLPSSRHPKLVTNGITCRTDARRDASAVLLPSAFEPVAQCKKAWEIDKLFLNRRRGGPVPNLVACINQSGAIDVFPGDDRTCHKLKMSSAQSLDDSRDSALLTLRQRIISSINEKCLSLSDALAIVDTALNEINLTHWSARVVVQTSNMTPQIHTCASAEIHELNSQIWVVPLPPSIGESK